MASTVTEVILKARDEGLKRGAEEAARAVDGLAAAETRAATAGRELDSVGDSAAKMGGKIEGATANAARLGAGLNFIVPGAGALTGALSGVADVAASGRVAMGGLGISTAALGPILAVAGAALLAYKIISWQAEAATKALKDAQERAVHSSLTLAEMMADVNKSLRSAELAKMSEGNRLVAETQDRWTASLEKTTAALRAELATVDQRSARAKEINAAIQTAAEAAMDGAAADIEAAQAAKERGAAGKTAAAGIKEQEQAETLLEKRLRENEAAFLAAGKEAEAIAESRAEALAEMASIGAAAEASLLSPLEAINAEADAQIAKIRALGEAWGVSAATVDGYVASIEAARTQDVGALAAPTGGAGGPSPENLAAGASVLSGVAGGGAGAVSAAAGPYGAIVAAAIQVIDAAADRVLADRVLDFVGSVGDGLENVGGEVSRIMVEGMQEGVPNLITGLLKFVEEFFTKVVPGYFQAMFSPKTWINIAEAIVVGVKDLFFGLAEAIVDGVLSLFGVDPNNLKGTGPLNLFGAEGGFEDLGANVGLSPNRDENRASGGGNSSRSRSAGTVNVYMTGLAIGTTQEFAREISRSMGTANRGITLPAGSVVA